LQLAAELAQSTEPIVVSVLSRVLPLLQTLFRRDLPHITSLPPNHCTSRPDDGHELAPELRRADRRKEF
jgi:hypothetical protein